MDYPRYFAHRGASAFAPENTLAAMLLAAKMGSRWVEFDVCLSKCGEVIVFHDDNLRRMCGVNGLVKDYTLAELKKLTIMSRFLQYCSECIVTLNEMIDCLNHCQLAANIELKPVVGEEHILAKAVATCIEQHWPATLTPPIFSSFHHKSLVYLRQYLPACHVALLFHRWHRACIALLKEHNAIALHANYRSLTPQRVALVKQQGFYVAAYTVNKVALMNKLFARGVDAVFSDYPNLQGE